ncbi:hypothetical protein HPP92_001517 [Vanilla planifolia]|uniref:Uncharacterized protein n=1 Tax=Vanilla planifolia TaxID=51239 RepID=A0A835VHM2_VANPL|nr:hypothetical protein HPP92_001517 [Vanilla planifolia]
MDETVIDNEVVSDSESIICERIHENALEEKALLRLDEGSLEYINLKHRFFLCLGSLAERCSVVVIRRMVPCSSAMSRAQVMAFKLFEKAVAEKNGGYPNVKLGWYGTSADGILRILRSGFDYGALPIGEFRHGLCIYGDCSVANCILQCATDANGLKHRCSLPRDPGKDRAGASWINTMWSKLGSIRLWCGL